MNAREFFGSENSDRLEKFGADLVLAAIAAGDGQKSRADAQAAREKGQHAVVLVVRVCGDIENVESDRQAAKCQAEAGGALILRKRRQLGLRANPEAENEKA